MLLSRRNEVAYRALEAFCRHRRLFSIAVLGITGIVMLALYMRSQTYSASAATQIVTEQEVSDVLGFAKTSWTTPAQQNVRHMNDLLKDDEIGGFLDTAFQAAHLKHPINVDPRARDGRLDELRKRLTVHEDSDDVFSLSLTWNDPGECERILRALQAGYIEESGSSRQAASIATAKFLDGQIESYEVRMRAAEQALIAYKRNHFGQLPEAQATEIERLASLKADRDFLKVTSMDAAMKQSALEQHLAQVMPTTVMEQTTSNVPVALSPVQQGIADMQTKRAALLADGWLPESTPVKDLDAQILYMRQQAAASDKAAAGKTPQNALPANVVETKTHENPEYRSLIEQLTDAKIAQTTNAARMQMLNQQIAEYDQRVQELPSALRDLTDRTRDYTILKEEYEDLLKRREQAHIKASLDRVAATSTLRPIGTIYAIPSLDHKKTVILFVGSFVLGLVVGLGLIVLAEWTDPTLRYEADVERLLGIPVISGLPLITGPPQGKLLAAADPVMIRGEVQPATITNFSKTDGPVPSIVGITPSGG